MTRLFSGTPFDIPPKCEVCGQLETECSCSPQERAEAEARRQREADRVPPQQQTARVRVEKRKGGRRVTVVAGLASRANDLPELLKQLQSVCGAGGTVKAKEDLLELQGDHAGQVREKLRQLGYRVP